MSYDIIGDIHGQAAKLESLLSKMGYLHDGDSWRHPRRTAIFVGDFIDRGPHQLRTLQTVRPMIDSGAALAVMGNHELNAIAWHTPHPDGKGDYLRSRYHPQSGEKNRKQHLQFLNEVEDDKEQHAELVAWFMGLPLWLDLPGFRVVHACWHSTCMDWLAPYLTEAHQLKPSILEAATCEPEYALEKDNAAVSIFSAVEAVTKGLEIALPDGHAFLDKDGIQRSHVRVRWWDAHAADYPEAALIDKAIRDKLPRQLIPPHARIALLTEKPVFFGHYWMTGEPAILTPHAACVDYSAGKGGPLVAYRWEGESILDSRNFVSAG